MAMLNYILLWLPSLISEIKNKLKTTQGEFWLSLFASCSVVLEEKYVTII